ncbi:MAG TPA: hypothetical protein VFZ91_06315 [Allosphingosinicella sp.]
MPRRIDWRRESEALNPYIRGEQSGVIRIDYKGESSAWHVFDAILKGNFGSNLAIPVASLRMDRGWHTTHLLTDVLGALSGKLAEAGFPAQPTTPTPAAKVLSGNKFRGPATINIEHLYVGGTSVADQIRERNALIKDVCSRLSQMFSVGGRFMLVLHHSEPDNQNYFWRDLWEGNLSSFVTAGLSLVYYFDETSETELHYCAPRPNLRLSLPATFEDETREGDAYDDLIDLLVDEGLDPRAAADMATSLLISSRKDVSALHNNLFELLVEIKTPTFSKSR